MYCPTKSYDQTNDRFIKSGDKRDRDITTLYHKKVIKHT